MKPAGRLRVLLTLAMAGASSLALANGAMGLALEMFEYRTWTVYVVVTVILEAWMIGVRGGLFWPKSLAVSLFANLITACVCPCLATPLLHVDAVNPNPFGYVVQMLFAYGLLSGVIEACVWRTFRSNSMENALVESKPTWPKGIFTRSLLAHLIGVPIALLILLSPSRPYQGMERTAKGWRETTVLRTTMRDFGNVVLAEEKVPKFSSVEDLIHRYATSSIVTENPDAWTAGYLPEFDRFDTGEMRRRPVEWNRMAPGAKITGKPGKLWLIRTDDRREVWGYVVNLETGEVARSFDPKELGFSK